MKKLNYILIGIIAALMALNLSSCGEDRSGEYENLIGADTWIKEVMDDYYLWYKDIPELSEDAYFADAESFFGKLLSHTCQDNKGDSYSYIEVPSTDTATKSISIDKTSTYGFDFMLYRDPTGASTHYYARVLYVMPDSPASECGLKRGQWIEAVNSKNLTSANYELLLKGEATTLSVVELQKTDDASQWSSAVTIALPASRYMEDKPFNVDSVYTINGKKIAYLVCSNFSTGPNDEATDTQYATQMNQLFGKFKSNQPDAFVLDLRYNQGGYVTMAQKMASLLAPQADFGKIFCTLKYNDKHEDMNITYKLDADFASANNLNLGKLYILTSKYTASAAELIINGLTPLMGKENIILIGTATEGKNVASAPFTSDKYPIILHPIVATCYNSADESDYINGFTPTYEADELNSNDTLLPLGDTQETLLAKAIDLIVNGTTTRVSEIRKSSISKMGFNSMDRKRQPAVRIK